MLQWNYKGSLTALCSKFMTKKGLILTAQADHDPCYHSRVALFCRKIEKISKKVLTFSMRCDILSNS